jgi:DNA-binding SARP family transcriptional activator
MALGFLLLGPLEIRRDGVPLDLGPPKRRALLTRLLLSANEVVPLEALVDSLWGAAPPASAKAVVHNHVHALRVVLGADRLERHGDAYRIVVEPGELDAARFEQLVEAAAPRAAGTRARLLREALGCWRGDPTVGNGVDGDARRELERLLDLRLSALEWRIEADLELGVHATVVPELEALVRQHPLRETLWRLLMVALYRSGRQAEALATYRAAHRAFVDELGLEPSPVLRELQRAILVQDPGLEVDSESDPLSRMAALLPHDAAGRARALVDYAHALGRLGDVWRAIAMLEHAERQARDAGDRITAELARLRRATLEVYRHGSLTTLLEQTRAAVATFEAAGDDELLAEALRHQGLVLRDLGCARDAAAAFESSAAAAARARDSYNEAYALNCVATALAVGPTPVEDAIAKCEQLLRPEDDPRPTGPVGLWASLGLLHVQAGRLDRGRALLAAARNGCCSAGTPSTLGFALTFSALAESVAGDFEAAERFYREAWDLFDALGYTATLPVYASCVAYAALRRGNADSAAGVAERGIPPLADDDFTAQVWCRWALSAALLALGRVREAVAVAEEAVTRARRGDWVQLLAETLEGLATARRAAHDWDGAAAARAEAVALHDQRGSVVSAARARTQTSPLSEVGSASPSAAATLRGLLITRA